MASDGIRGTWDPKCLTWGRPFTEMEHLESNGKRDIATVGNIWPAPRGVGREFDEGLLARVWAKFRETNELRGGPKGSKSVEPLAGGGLNCKRRKQYLSQVVLLVGVEWSGGEVGRTANVGAAHRAQLLIREQGGAERRVDLERQTQRSAWGRLAWSESGKAGGWDPACDQGTGGACSAFPMSASRTQENRSCDKFK